MGRGKEGVAELRDVREVRDVREERGESKAPIRVVRVEGEGGLGLHLPQAT